MIGWGNGLSAVPFPFLPALYGAQIFFYQERRAARLQAARKVLEARVTFKLLPEHFSGESPQLFHVCASLKER
jgi:hypothetical protein